MVTIDVLVGAICALVFVLNELWSDGAKSKIVYRKMPSDTVFTDISTGEIDATGFDLDKAKSMYADMADASANQQTAKWNLLLKDSRERNSGNVVEAERMQLMTRDICVTTISLLIMNIVALGVLMIVADSALNPLKALWLPLVYLVVMFFVTRTAARSRAKRFILLVIKNDVQKTKSEAK
jgi:hypothetical protein